MLKQSWYVLAFLSLYTSLSYAPDGDDFIPEVNREETTYNDQQGRRQITITVTDDDAEQLAGEVDKNGRVSNVTLAKTPVVDEQLPTEVTGQKTQPVVNQQAVNKLLENRDSLLQYATDDTAYTVAVENTLLTMDEDWADSKSPNVQNAFDIVNKRQTAPSNLYNEPIKKYQEALQDLHKALRKDPVNEQQCSQYLEQMKEQVEKVAELNTYEENVHPVRKVLNAVTQGLKTAWKGFMRFVRKSSSFRSLERYLKKTSADQITSQTAVDKQLSSIKSVAKDNADIQQGLSLEEAKLLTLATEVRTSLLTPQQDAVESLSSITKTEVDRFEDIVVEQLKNNLIINKLQTFLDSDTERTMPAFLKSEFASDMQQHIQGLKNALLINKQQETVKLLRQQIADAQFFLAEVARQYQEGVLKTTDKSTLVGNYQTMLVDFLDEALADIQSAVKEAQLSSLRESEV